MVDDVVAVQRGIDDRHRDQRLGHRLAYVGQVARGPARRRPGRPERGDAGEVNLEHRVHMRRRPTAPHHVLGDTPPHRTHRLDPPAATGGEGCLRPRHRVGARRAATRYVCEHVGLRDTAAAPGSHDRGQIDVVLGGEFPHHRRPSAGCRCAGDRPGCRSGRAEGEDPIPSFDGVAFGRRRDHCLALGTDHRHDRVDRHRLPHLCADLSQHTTGRRRDLGVDLVGRDLEERLIPVNGLANLLDPAHDRTLGDGFTHLGHQHIGRHLLVSRLRGAVPQSLAVFIPRPAIARRDRGATLSRWRCC